ncbi:Hypothetical protein POVN_LOCUS429 [uncultured virus]|nr:Hypothetical protein POVN_LOCUS429 [uncultured virus]
MMGRQSAPSLQAAFDALPAFCKTNAYCPDVKRIIDAKEDGDFDKFGGVPSVEPDFKWPTCCNRPMQFFFQLTNPMTGRTIQMFNCIDKGCYGGGAFSSKIRYISYDFHKMANLAEAERALHVKYAYAEYEKEYYNNWLNLRYGYIPYACFRVMGWRTKKTFVVPSERLIDLLASSGYMLQVPKPDVKAEAKAEAKPEGKVLTAEELEEAKLEAEAKQEEEEIERENAYLSDLYYNTSAYTRELHFGGLGNSCQGVDYSKMQLHFSGDEYLPYMWGDAGDAHIGWNLKLEMDCC